MQPVKSVKKSLIVISSGIGLSFCGSKALAQPPQGPPPPPPNPVEVFKKINPFKKKAKSNADKTPPAPGNAPAPGTAPSTGPGQPPPPPPNPLDLFKKKKKDTVKRAAPRHQA